LLSDAIVFSFSSFRDRFIRRFCPERLFKAEKPSYQDFSRKSSSFEFRGGFGPGKRQGDSDEGPDFRLLDLHLSRDPVGGNGNLHDLPRFEKTLLMHLLIVLDGIILMP
jgi:hypothetical protein